MKGILLATGILLNTVTSANVIAATGTGSIHGYFSSIEYMGETVRTDPENYDPFGMELAVFGQANGMYDNGQEYSYYDWGVQEYPSGGEGAFENEYGWSDNNLTFISNEFSEQAKGESFVAGTLWFNNGVSITGTNPYSVEFNLSSSSSDQDFNQNLAIEIAIASSLNEDDFGNPLSAELAADYIYFPMFPEYGSLRVFEGEAGAVEILAEFNSLHFKGFGDVLTPDVAFVSSSLTTIPLPATVWLFGTALLGVIGRGRKKGKA